MVKIILNWILVTLTLCERFQDRLYQQKFAFLTTLGVAHPHPPKTTPLRNQSNFTILTITLPKG